MPRAIDVLNQTLEFVGKLWAENYVPQAIRRDEAAISLLLAVRDLAENGQGGSSGELALSAPTFSDQYAEILMRSFPVPTHSGVVASGSHG